MSDTLVIIPAFNEEKNIANVIERLTNTLNDVDYVIVNDGSIDATSKICKESTATSTQCSLTVTDSTDLNIFLQ